MIGRRALATSNKSGLGRGAAVKKKRWQLELAGELDATDDERNRPLREEAPAISTKRRDGSEEFEKSPCRSVSRSRSHGRQRRTVDPRSDRDLSAAEEDLPKCLRQHMRAMDDLVLAPWAAASQEDKEETANLVATEVESFSDFVRHAEQLVKIVAGLPPMDLVAVCRNMAQVKFYDGDLIREVWQALRGHIPAGHYPVSDLTEIITALRGLNAYDHCVFHEAARYAMRNLFLLGREQRQLWYECYQDLKHQGDDDFIMALKKGPSTDSTVIGSSSRLRQAVCMLHGKQRSIDNLICEGGGHYTCAPNRRCK